MKINLLRQLIPGMYHANFRSVTKTSHEEYGTGVRWDFQVDEGDYSGTIVGRTTKDTASANNSCGRFWEMVSGLPLEDAIQHDTDEWLGDAGTIVVERAPSGDGLRVAEFVRDDAQ